MSANATAFPLSWPLGRPRAGYREPSRFDTSFARARDGLATELERLGARNVVLSTNVELRIDGQPYANRPEPGDPGVAIYFTYKGKAMCFACDRWNRVRDNIHAVGKTIEAFRGIERWGTGSMVEAAFAGFAALPAPTEMGEDWRSVLGAGPNSTLASVEQTYRALRSAAHPDRNGGSQQEFERVQRAWEQAKKELGP